MGGGPQEAQIQGAQKGNVTAASKLIVLTAPGGCEKMLAKAYKNFARWALDPLVNGIIYIYITPLSRVKNPSYPFIRPLIGFVIPFINGSGPPCRIPVFLGCDSIA